MNEVTTVEPVEVSEAPVAMPEPATANIFAALAKAQGQFPAIPKNKKGHGYNYAPMDTIQRIVRPVLAKHGLGFYQTPRGDDMVTVLFHESGERIEVPFPMVDIQGRMNAMQMKGAVSTYASRYGLCLALGISADEDTDAHENGSAGPALGEDFTNPNRDGHVEGVKGVTVDKNAPPDEQASAYAEGIAEQLREAKTIKGLAGAWDRNGKVIERLQHSYPKLHETLVDAYENLSNDMQENAG